MTARSEARGGQPDSARTRYVAGALALAALTVAIFVGAGRLPSGVQAVLGFSVIFFVGALAWVSSSLRRRAGAQAGPARAATATLNAYGVALLAALLGYYLLRDQDWAWAVGLLPATVCLVSAARVARG
ncbi:hypothetical protein [Micromonospora endolithica]|uniref:Uncharacterized protein n=1 Tax=Micromonospora endolithica TaxID=230091 RepID=A0A3A9ZAI0_9ACTN|nr:hypothetical protein [Micromonospora endolithica]RKN45320.1 hypothetical protein D7223_17000 [Micromonospora endolithica]TWJ22987.1 hypothetical protein JD76_03111 [Micromonospora endolithica]